MRTHVTGEFAVEPVLNWCDFRESKFAPHNITDRWSPSLMLLVDEETVDTFEGPLHRRSSTALVMREIEEFTAYTLVEEVQEAIDAFTGFTFTGHLDCRDEDGELWRVVVRDNRARKVQPVLTWPED